MRRGLLGLALFLGIVAIKLAVFAYLHEARQRPPSVDNLNPALHRMSVAALTGSDWAYTGPLGPLTLRFETKGRLTVIASGEERTGKWMIEDVLLIASIPGVESPHHGIFRTSTDELSGMSPPGLTPKTWSAKRIRPAE